MIFIDRSIPRPVADALKQTRNDVLYLEDLFAANTLGPVWLQRCGQERWLIITRDKKIQTRPDEYLCSYQPA